MYCNSHKTVHIIFPVYYYYSGLIKEDALKVYNPHDYSVHPQTVFISYSLPFSSDAVVVNLVTSSFILLGLCLS